MTTTRRAVSEPWAWNSDQIFIVVIGILIVAGSARWCLIWWREGTEGVKDRWTQMTTLSGYVYWRSLTIWIVVAIALVIYFNLNQK